MRVPISADPGILWPAIPDASNAILLALQYQLEQSQWWSREEIESQQLRQLEVLLAHAHKYVPFYRDALAPYVARNFKLDSLEDLRELPLLRREHIQNQVQQLTTKALPKSHMPVYGGATSGSTGMPIKFFSTRVTRVFNRAFILRSHLWHDRDLTVDAASLQLKTDEKQGGADGPREGDVRWIDAFPSGLAGRFDSGRPVTEQLAWLQDRDPEWLITYPSNLAALAGEARSRGVSLPRLKYLDTLGELVTPQIRELCREVWGLPIVDLYSARELHVIAVQCPENEHYHVQSERHIVEILDADGRPCGPGETGRVVITDLHNFAMPFIRYEIGDYAEVGEQCSCGRTLPVLKQILGRARNMLTLPSGDRVWPRLRVTALADVGPVKQLQVVQHTPRDIEVKIVMGGPPYPGMEANLLDAAQGIFDAISPGFAVRLNIVDSIPRSNSGKFEDFMSRVADE